MCQWRGTLYHADRKFLIDSVKRVAGPHMGTSHHDDAMVNSSAEFIASSSKAQFIDPSSFHTSTKNCSSQGLGEGNACARAHAHSHPHARMHAHTHTHTHAQRGFFAFKAIKNSSESSGVTTKIFLGIVVPRLFQGCCCPACAPRGCASVYSATQRQILSLLIAHKERSRFEGSVCK